ncbi:hypothetical protein Y032_0839g2622 [Ancylostoma ceylanicum]|uniref:Uncharacterized protein n=1 Tax=Ancylostoma ceylanicum TaxID=53326 RepID=A0A016WBH4_9BILA|nr:hypothetical protein Y032_0839g2622 [Ancylostoma ceylanicum]
MDKSLDDYKSQLLQAVAETHDRVEEYNERRSVVAEPAGEGPSSLQCSDGCFDDVRLNDISGCSFPGAVGKEPVSTLWSAWLAASIFRRTDLDLGEKIRYHREGVVCHDSEALKSVLKMAFQRCIDWTEFVCNTKKIMEHAPIEGNYFDTSYDEALRIVREEMERKR